MAGKAVKYLVRFIPASLLVLLLAVPLLVLLFQWISITVNTGLSSLLNTAVLSLIGKSFLISGSVAFFATIIGTLCGFLLYKFEFPLKGFFKLTLLIPLLVPPYIFAVAWKDGWQWFFGNTSEVYSVTAVVIVHTLVFFPLAMLITGSAFSQIHKGIEEAGMMTVSFRRMVIKIILPLVRPALTISFLLIFIFSLSDFSVPAFFGTQTFTTEIFTQFSAFYNYQMAISQSILLLLICLVLMMWEARYLSDAPFFSIGTKGSYSKQYEVNKRRMLLHITLFLLLFIAVLLPVFTLILQSFSGKEIEFARALKLIYPTILQSVTLALLGASIISLTGLWVAFMKEKYNFKLPNTLTLITFIIPSTVFGIALIGFFNRPATNFIYASFLIILIGYSSRFTFIAARITGNGLKQIPVSLEEAAAIIGIHPVKKFFKINLPMLLPSLFTSFVLAFVLCLGELGTTIMVYPPGTELMPIKIFTISANATQSLTGSMILINFSVSIGFLMLFYILGKIIFKKYGYV